MFEREPAETEKGLAALRLRLAEHPFWNHRLLTACREGGLSLDDYRYLFSQYHLYSSNFTRYLAALMVHCPSDLFRARLSQNLWDEGGGCDPAQRHSELFRNFLRQGLGVDDRTIEYADFTRHFVQQFFAGVDNDDCAAGTAFLALGTESLVPRLYQIFCEGLRSAGIDDGHLTFFQVHIENDDAHAATLVELLLSMSARPEWFDVSLRAMNHALSLRMAFFDAVLERLRRRRLDGLVERIQARASLAEDRPAGSRLHVPRGGTGEALYANAIERLGIEFTVERLPFAGEALDARVVRIPPGRNNENHRHAHETVFHILAGAGTVHVGDEKLPVVAGDTLFVPRWCLHQAHCTGAQPLVILAVTDYGLTSRAYVGNYEKTARPFRDE